MCRGQPGDDAWTRGGSTSPGGDALVEYVGMRREGHYIRSVWFKGGWGEELSFSPPARRVVGAADPVNGVRDER
jgi:hypothetical protein